MTCRTSSRPLRGHAADGRGSQAVERQYGIPAAFNPLLGRQLFIYQNLSRIYTRGFEVDGEASLGRGFRVRGAYTFLDARDQVTGAPLTQRHKHQGFVAATISIAAGG